MGSTQRERREHQEQQERAEHEQEVLEKLRNLRQEMEPRIWKRLSECDPPTGQAALIETREYACWHLVSVGWFRYEDVPDLVNTLMGRIKASPGVLELLRFDTPAEDVANLLEAIVEAYALHRRTDMSVPVTEADYFTSLSTAEMERRLGTCRDMMACLDDEGLLEMLAPQVDQSLYDGLRQYEKNLRTHLDFRQLKERKRKQPQHRPRTALRKLAEAVDEYYKAAHADRDRLAVTLARDILEVPTAPAQIAELMKTSRRRRRRDESAMELAG